jgi:hypothetical protein
LFSFFASSNWQVIKLLNSARPLRAYVVVAYFVEIARVFKGKGRKGQEFVDFGGTAGLIGGIID